MTRPKPKLRPLAACASSHTGSKGKGGRITITPAPKTRIRPVTAPRLRQTEGSGARTGGVGTGSLHRMRRQYVHRPWIESLVPRCLLCRPASHSSTQMADRKSKVVTSRSSAVVSIPEPPICFFGTTTDLRQKEAQPSTQWGTKPKLGCGGRLSDIGQGIHMGTSGSHSNTTLKERTGLKVAKLCKHTSCLSAEAAPWPRLNKEGAGVGPHTELRPGPSL